MIVIHHTDKEMGSLDWELPKNVSEYLEKIPEEAREYIIQALKMHVRGMAHSLLGTVLTGPMFGPISEFIAATQEEMTRDVIELIKSIK